MKLLLIILMSCLFSWGALAEKITVDIQGMTCEMCIGSVTKELKATQKCDKIEVKVGQALLETKKGAKLSDEEIKKAVKASGYQATKIKRI